jgi:DNA polymerase-3 subunit delta
VAVYLVLGSDLRLVSARLTDLVDELVGDRDRTTTHESFDLGGTSTDERQAVVSNAVSAAQTQSLFQDVKVVVLREIGEATVEQLSPLVKYLPQVESATHLVLTSTSKLAKSTLDALKNVGATVFETNPPSRKNEVYDWFDESLQEAGINVEPAAIAAMVEWLGEDRARLPGLIEVLSSTYGTSKKLSIVDIEPFLGEKGSVLPWDLTDAIDKADSAVALMMLRRMIRSGEYHPLQVMSLLHNHYSKLLRLDGPVINSVGDAKTLIGSKSDFQARKYMDVGRRMGSRNVSAAVHLLARADIDLRGGRDLEEELTMEILVARLCRLSGGGTTSLRRR